MRQGGDPSAHMARQQLASRVRHEMNTRRNNPQQPHAVRLGQVPFQPQQFSPLPDAGGPIGNGGANVPQFARGIASRLLFHACHSVLLTLFSSLPSCSVHVVDT